VTQIDWTHRIENARRAVASVLSPTPLVAATLDGFDAPAYLKLETVQPTGSFKVRGALAAVAASAADGARVVTASAGNHGLGLAFAAARMGVEATIVVPETASPAKVAALRRFPVDLRLAGTGYDEAEAVALGLAAASGVRFISAYTHPDVIAGQSTIVREVADQLPGAFRIVVPVGGGGLVSGTALGAPDHARVLGVESAASRAVSASVAAGHVVDVEVGATLADGLAGNLARDAITPAILTEHGTELTAVDEVAIRAAIRTLALQHGIVAEGAGAVGVAAAHATLVSADLPAVFVITGRNIAAATLLEVLSA
jgi:threonine dehydratase